MIKVLVIVAVWLIGMLVSAAVSDGYTKVEPIAYAYSAGFAIALGLGLWIAS